jgi:hypothetical protein
LRLVENVVCLSVVFVQGESASFAESLSQSLEIVVFFVSWENEDPVEVFFGSRRELWPDK